MMEVVRTSVFRLSLAYAVGFSMLAVGGLALAYWSISKHSREQVDTVLFTDANELEALYRSRGIAALAKAVARRGAVAGPERLYYSLQRSDGAGTVGDLELFATDSPDDGAPEVATRSAPAGISGTRTPASDKARMRVLTRQLADGSRLRVGHPVHAQEAILAHAKSVVTLTAATIVIVAIVGGTLVGMRIVSRVSRLNRTAEGIIAGDLAARLPVSDRNDEFDRLSVTVNRMLDRIGRLIGGMREVTDNVAHDIRSPLGRIRNGLELGLVQERGPAEYEATIRRAVEQSDQLLRTLNAMLSLAEIEAGTRENVREVVDLTAIVDDLGELYEDAGSERDIKLDLRAMPNVWVHGDRQLIAQAVSNLVENAIKFTSPGDRVTLSLEVSATHAIVRVADNGPGIPAAERMHVLGRFVRLDNARATPGNGLGLSVVNAIAGQHGAKLHLYDHAPGLIVDLEFPRSWPAAARAECRARPGEDVKIPRVLARGTVHQPSWSTEKSAAIPSIRICQSTASQLK